jgi:hypothetical protein
MAFRLERIEYRRFKMLAVALTSLSAGSIFNGRVVLEGVVDHHIRVEALRREQLNANPKPVKQQAANSENAIGCSPNNTGPWPK